ncbi:MAG TPA: sigma-70 family RNA polymerase sigma factor [Povalibacter sp.]|uniref:RNA polymerase sigma factor n=1 Tax=Povalibacter sp. TaxID=1962978 RepID=UPI002D0FF86F|nr:sigma-70 family RNA polymerase sigma factor [Povalibacter sp.]HMN44561.1 sigma-70 family RNA polymerase sigma factor [Povalibacter sp.]
MAGSWDRQSVLALIESQYTGLLRLLRQKLRNEQLAADALSQALITTLEHLDAGRISEPQLIGGYIFQVAMNQMRNHRRKMAERSERRADPEAVDALPAPDTGIDKDLEPAIATKVRSVIEALSTTRDREIVKRFYLDEEDKASICSDMGLSALHFDKVIFRARQRMRGLLESQGLRGSDFFSLLIICVTLM